MRVRGNRRGFESRLSAITRADLNADRGVARAAPLTHIRVRSRRCSTAPCARRPSRRADVPWRSRPGNHADRVRDVQVSGSGVGGATGWWSGTPFGIPVACSCSIPGWASECRAGGDLSPGGATRRGGAGRRRARDRRRDRDRELSLACRPRGPESRLPRRADLRQAAEWELAHTTDHTILEWIDFPGATYVPLTGTTSRSMASGSSPRRPTTRSPRRSPWRWTTASSLAGQAVYTGRRVGGQPDELEGRSGAPIPTPTTARSSASADWSPSSISVTTDGPGSGSDPDEARTIRGILGGPC